MRKIVILTLFLAVAAILAGCKPSAQPAAQAGNDVTIQDFAFIPASLIIKAGDTVNWTNKDFAPHSINSEILNSTVLNQGDSFNFTFGVPGNYSYICAVHPFMRGAIIAR